MSQFVREREPVAPALGVRAELSRDQDLVLDRERLPEHRLAVLDPQIALVVEREPVTLAQVVEQEGLEVRLPQIPAGAQRPVQQGGGGRVDPLGREPGEVHRSRRCLER